MDDLTKTLIEALQAIEAARAFLASQEPTT
jgi:hypothetical protein